MAQRIPNSTTTLLINGNKLVTFPQEIREMNLGIKPNIQIFWSTILQDSNDITKSFNGIVDNTGNFKEFTEEEKELFQNEFINS
jgi:hypothetical protein